jgi:hypothetical protein
MLTASYSQICASPSSKSSHGLVVKRMTSNHEILGSTPSNRDTAFTNTYPVLVGFARLHVKNI